MMILGYEYCFLKIPRKIKMVGFNCGRKGHLKRKYRQSAPTNNFILEVIQTEGPRTGGTDTSTTTDKSIIKISVIIE